MTLTTAPEFEHSDEQRLAAFGLSTIFHDGLRAGATRATNRSALALETSPGTDIYHDGMESLAQILAPEGWRLMSVDKQPRLVHPEGLSPSPSPPVSTWEGQHAFSAHSEEGRRYT